MSRYYLVVSLGVFLLSGCDGEAGKDGTDGTDGVAGADGVTGADGEAGVGGSEADGDGDGIGVFDDCDDTDDSVGAPTEHYIDLDGDGYGYAGVVDMLCAPLDGWVANADDCDDLDENISPEAVEVCDGIDNDCNGDLDDEDAGVDLSSGITVYTDADGDGYGDDAATGVLACAVSSGFASVQGDCDDAAPDVSPDAEEICSNGVDDNCDGGAPECVLDAELSQGSDDMHSLQPAGLEDGDYFGAYQQGVGDFNGDGYSDLMVGAFGDDDGGSDAGAAYLFLGSSSLGATLSSEAGKITGATAGGAFGFTLDSAGDVNDDGFDDLVVGAYQSDEAFLVYGSASGLTGTQDVSALVAAGTGAAFTVSSSYYLGYEVQGVGDTNADGYDDLIVVDYASYSTSSTGVAYLVMGAASGLTGTQDLGTVAQAELSQEEMGDYFGYVGASDAGDFNADGYADVVVGEYGNDADGYAYGRAFMWTGPISGASSGSSASVIFKATSASGDTYLGHDVESIGDWNGDGYDDLAIGGYYYDGGGSYDSGGVFVYFGSTSWSATVDIAAADVTIEGDDNYDHSSFPHRLGDLDGDGTDDLAVGAKDADNSSYSSGEVGIFLGMTGSAGGTFSLSGDADVHILGATDESYQYIGRVVTGADLDNDGNQEVYVGDNLDSNARGQVSVFEVAGL